MGVRTVEPGTSKIVRYTGGLAIPGRNPSNSFRLAEGSQNTAAQRRGYNNPRGLVAASSLARRRGCRGAGSRGYKIPNFLLGLRRAVMRKGRTPVVTLIKRPATP